jgi:hypothetical protein
VSKNDDPIILQINNLVTQLSGTDKNRDKVKAEIEKCTKQDGFIYYDMCLHVYRSFDCFRQNNSELIKTSLHCPEHKIDEDYLKHEQHMIYN